MTSEVLMLNRDAVVIAADSAVTTGRDPHPRYSKSANKIFDLCAHGNVALTIFEDAEIDRVPWELAIKLFRAHDAATPQRPALSDYIQALVDFLQGNC